MSATLSFSELRDLLEAIFLRHGTSPDVAAILAENCALCERDGATSHGVFRMQGYVDSLKSGWVDGKADPLLEDVAPGFLRVDANNGFAQPALEAARATLLEKVRTNGIALLAIRNSHHLSALWPDLEPFARQGLVALSAVNSFACTVPHGGKVRVFGTNPLAFAAPREGADPIIFDMATSFMANGEIQIAAQKGEALPAGAGVDASGAPTTDPRAVLDGGALLPFGGHKGSSISMMVELLGAALTGGHFSFEFDWSGHKGAATPHTGQLLVLIDPSHGGGLPFGLRANDLVARMRASGVDRMPGERRMANRARAEREGIPLSDDVLGRLYAYAGRSEDT
ncbi:Ldh family oxidoreductase [Pelagibacterium montanilacus]|uniref:Ldh family oxidoreductase n=1 Tax=Pelagibacterium montanilacus TaxID=2185280 RepID=UPI000F8D1912|nr:Ldh family oxidoreductase [Pelagibacterium montanilacus]